MGDVKYRLKNGQPLTDEQIKEIEIARDRDIEFDEDSPEIDPKATPELYEAMMNAVRERNRRLNVNNKRPA